MRIKSVSFENYKSFFSTQQIRLRPVTLLLGKNSSGKSSIAKLFTLLSNSLGGSIKEPLLTTNYGVELGAQFRDLAFARNSSPINFEVEVDNGTCLKVSVVEDATNSEVLIVKWSFGEIELTYSPDTGYIDRNHKHYDVNFKGFMPVEGSEGLLEAVPVEALKQLVLPVDYIGPFRELPQRQFHLTGQLEFDHTGIRGENAYAMLGVSHQIDHALVERVGNWFEEYFDGWRLIVEKVDSPSSSFFQVLLTKKQPIGQSEGVAVEQDVSVNIVDVGEGMNQVLPIVVRCFQDRPGSTIVLEQPELHLHPAAHADVAELIARSAISGQQTFIVETHAENFLLRLRALALDNDFGFSKDDLVIYWVDESEEIGQHAIEITIDSEGRLSDWKDGVFNENLKEILTIQKALKEK